MSADETDIIALQIRVRVVSNMPARRSARHPAATLPPFDEESGDLNAVVETTAGSRNKFAYDAELGLFRLKGVLPAGASFPFDFGFVPSTRGGDGDPLDVLVLMDEPAFAGCLVPARLLGVITAEQRERDGTVEQNDRLVAVASDSHTHEGVRTLEDLSRNLLDEIEHFFVSYNQARGKTFTPTGRKGRKAARKIVEEGARRFTSKRSKSKGRS
jgi:inorganic pyrophosphatase